MESSIQAAAEAHLNGRKDSQGLNAILEFNEPLHCHFEAFNTSLQELVQLSGGFFKPRSQCRVIIIHLLGKFTRHPCAVESVFSVVLCHDILQHRSMICAETMYPAHDYLSHKVYKIVIVLVKQPDLLAFLYLPVTFFVLQLSKSG